MLGTATTMLYSPTGRITIKRALPTAWGSPEVVLYLMDGMPQKEREGAHGFTQKSVVKA